MRQDIGREHCCSGRYLQDFLQGRLYLKNRQKPKLHCIVLYCIMRPYTEGCLDRYRIGIPRELSEIRNQPWLSEGSLTCDPYHHRGPIF